MVSCQGARDLSNAGEECMYDRANRSILHGDDSDLEETGGQINRQYFQREPGHIESQHGAGLGRNKAVGDEQTDALAEGIWSRSLRWKRQALRLKSICQKRTNNTLTR